MKLVDLFHESKSGFKAIQSKLSQVFYVINLKDTIYDLVIWVTANNIT